MTEESINLPAAFELITLAKVVDLRKSALEYASQGSPEGTLIWAHQQEQATTYAAEPWQSFDGNLFASIVLEPEVDPASHYEMLYVAMVSLGNAVAEHVSPMTALGYRWPNDLMIAGYKIASVWVDRTEAQNGSRLVLTFAVNVISSPDQPEGMAMSILEAEGTSDLDAGRLLESLARHFISEINYWAERGFSNVLSQWKVRAEIEDQQIKRQIHGQLIEGDAKSVNEAGGMELTTSDGISLTLGIDEVLGWDNRDGKQK